MKEKYEIEIEYPDNLKHRIEDLLRIGFISRIIKIRGLKKMVYGEKKT